MPGLRNKKGDPITMRETTRKLKPSSLPIVTKFGDVRSPAQQREISHVLEAMAYALHSYFKGEIGGELLDAIFDYGDLLIDDIADDYSIQ